MLGERHTAQLWRAEADGGSSQACSSGLVESGALSAHGAIRAVLRVIRVQRVFHRPECHRSQEGASKSRSFASLRMTAHGFGDSLATAAAFVRPRCQTRSTIPAKMIGANTIIS